MLRILIVYNVIIRHSIIHSSVDFLTACSEISFQKSLETKKDYVSIKIAIKFLVCKLYHKRARKTINLSVCYCGILDVLYKYRMCVPFIWSIYLCLRIINDTKLHCVHITLMCAHSTWLKFAARQRYSSRKSILPSLSIANGA